MSMESAPSSDRSPESEPLPFDIMAELTAAQYEFDKYDAFEQMSRGLSLSHELNERLPTENISIAIKTKHFGLRSDDSDQIYTCVKQDESSFMARGQLLRVTQGWIGDIAGYVLVLKSRASFPNNPDEEVPCHLYVHMKTILDYHYQQPGHTDEVE